MTENSVVVATPPPVVDTSGLVMPADHGWLVMWRIEMTKLRAQLRVRLALAACVLGPCLFVLAESVQSQVPADTLFGRWVHESGFAVSLVILGFSTQWAIPLLIGMVAGDSFAEEDRHRTWSMLLTRSRSRTEVLVGKLLATASYTIAVTVLLGLSATLTGALAIGTKPLVGLDGTMLSSSTGWIVTTESWATALPPALAIMAVAVLVSVISRNSWVGVVVPLVIVFVLVLVSMLSAIDPVRPLLPTTGFYAWYGLVRTSVYTNQVWTSLLVNAGWVLVCLVGASVVFLRRDVVDS